MRGLIDFDSPLIAIAATLDAWTHTCEDGRTFETKTAAKDAGARVVHSACVRVPDAHKTLRLRVAQQMNQTRDTLRELGADDVTFFVSHPRRRWRSAIYPAYKATRARSPHLRRYATYVALQRGAVMAHDEADDAIATAAARARGDVLICSIDKDLLTVPGKHYNPRKPELGAQTITQEDAERNLLRQVIMGDRSDNIIGLAGVGEVGAARVLAQHPDTYELREAVRAMYAAAGRAAEYALNLRLLQLGERI